MNELEATRAKLKCLEMVEGTNLNWWDVVKIRQFYEDWKVCSKPINFSNESIGGYIFAIGVVEGKPVWEGDELYRVDGHKFTACEYGMSRCDHSKFSWNQPAPKTENRTIPPPELTWLYSHCRAIGMVDRSDTGLWEHDIALFTIRQKQKIDTLLYAVARKFEGETRFETALRYIREAESHEFCREAQEQIK